MEVNRIVAIEVAIAIFTASAGATPRCETTRVRKGTISAPPPMPSSPARKPMPSPSSSNSTTSSAAMVNTAAPPQGTDAPPRAAANEASAGVAASLVEQREHGAPLGGCDRRDRQPVAALEHEHRGERGSGAHLGQRQQPRLAHQLHVDVQ